MNALLTAVLLLLPQAKEESTYHFGTNPERTSLSFSGKTSVTNVSGSTHTISGSATIDFAKGTGRCHLVVPADSLKSGIEDLDNAMKGELWLDTARFKTIEFKAESASNDGKMWKLPGKFTFHGVTRDLEIEAMVIPLPTAISETIGAGKWVKVSVGFKVDIVAHGIAIDKTPYANVSKVWDVKVDLFGTTEPPKELVVAGAKVEDDPFDVVRPRKVSKEGLEGVLYRFGVKPQHTTVTATSETEAGTVLAKSILSAGYVGIDAAKGTGSARLSMPVKSFKTGIDARDELLHGPGGLNAGNHPHLEFESTRAVRKEAGVWSVEGNLTLHGVTKPVRFDAEVKELSEEEIRRAKWGDRAGLRFKTSMMEVKLSDFGVKAGIHDAWKIAVDLVALRDTK